MHIIFFLWLLRFYVSGPQIFVDPSLIMDVTIVTVVNNILISIVVIFRLIIKKQSY